MIAPSPSPLFSAAGSTSDPGALRQRLADMARAGKGSASQRAAGRLLSDYGTGARLMGRALGIDGPTDALLEAAGLDPIDGEGAE